MKKLLFLIPSLLISFGSAYASVCDATYFGIPFFAAGISSTKTEALCFYSLNPNENYPPINAISMQYGSFEPVGQGWSEHENFFIISDGFICRDTDPNNCQF